MKEYICLTCQKVFKTNHSLKYHTDKKVCSQKDKVYDCRYCTNKFTSTNAMYKHMRDVCKLKNKDEDDMYEIFEKLSALEDSNLKFKNSFTLLENENQLLKNEIRLLKKSTQCVCYKENIGMIDDLNTIVTDEYIKTVKVSKNIKKL